MEVKIFEDGEDGDLCVRDDGICIERFRNGKVAVWRMPNKDGTFGSVKVSYNEHCAIANKGTSKPKPKEEIIIKEETK